MDIESKEVQGAESASAQIEGVQKESLAPEIDLASEYDALMKENARLMDERDNYKTGMLQAKKRLKQDSFQSDDSSEEESEDERFARIARSVLAESESEKLLKKQEDLVKKALQENRELKIALQNRSQMNSSGGSAGSEKPASNLSHWSPEQIASLKRKGLNPDKVWENLQNQLTK